MASTFEVVLTAVLLQTTTGHGSQVVEQHDESAGTTPADQAVHARKPTRAAMPTALRCGFICRFATRLYSRYSAFQRLREVSRSAVGRRRRE